MVLLGVDLRSSPKHASAVAALQDTPEPELAFLDYAYSDEEIIDIAQGLQPRLIAIGAPLGLPDGLCCLETSCECQSQPPQRKGRQLELELARMGISCFFTSKGSIIRNLIYRGIDLSHRLMNLGFEVIEVYPHATKVILFGDSIPPKNSAGSLAFMKGRLPELIQGLGPHLASIDRNTCDALVNSYTALLHSRNGTDLLGSINEGLLALPKLMPEEAGVRF